MSRGRGLSRTSFFFPSLCVLIIVLKLNLTWQVNLKAVRPSKPRWDPTDLYIYTKHHRFNFLLSNIYNMKTKNVHSLICRAISWWKRHRGLVGGCVGSVGRVCWAVVWRGVRSCGDDGDPVLIGADMDAGVD